MIFLIDQDKQSSLKKVKVFHIHELKYSLLYKYYIHHFHSNQYIHLQFEDFNQQILLQFLHFDLKCFTLEFLNNIKCSRIPNPNIKLKVGVPIMLLRNINLANDFYKYTRL